MDECTTEQYEILLALDARLKAIEEKLKNESKKQLSAPVASSGSSTQRPRKSVVKASRTKKEVNVNEDNVSAVKVADLRKQFEPSGGRVLSFMSKLKLGKSGSRPPPRPMTLARGTVREGSGG